MTAVWEKPPISFFRMCTAADFLCSLYGEIAIRFIFLFEFKISRESVHWKQRRRRKDLLCKTIPDLMRVCIFCASFPVGTCNYESLLEDCRNQHCRISRHTENEIGSGDKREQAGELISQNSADKKLV